MTLAARTRIAGPAARGAVVAVLTLAVLALAMVGSALAQQARGADRRAGSPGEVDAPGTLAEARSMPSSRGTLFDLRRIKAGLAAQDAIDWDGLRFRSYLEVHGRLERQSFFDDFDHEREAVEYGAPTHDEMVRMMTPRNVHRGGIDVLGSAHALIGWFRGQR